MKDLHGTFLESSTQDPGGDTPVNMVNSEDFFASADFDGECHHFVASAVDKGQRLDLYLAAQIPSISRSLLGSLIRAALVRINGQEKKNGYRLKEGDKVLVVVPPVKASQIVPEEIDFAVLHEDLDLLVISKPPGLVVHPAVGHQKGTLVHGLLSHCDSLSVISGEQRPGIVHRLDKDTSGVMVIAKNDRTHRQLAALFKARKVEKVYHAVLAGQPEALEGRVALPIGRHLNDRKKMAVLNRGGRDAATNWKVIERLPYSFSFVELRPESGRTHQLRVHMSFKGCPVAGDLLYGRRKDVYDELGITRQCLHASMLSFVHPVTNEKVSFKAPLWPDIEAVLERLRALVA